MAETGKNQLFEFCVENAPFNEKKVEIQKIDAKTKLPLTGAEFTIYEYNVDLQEYEKTGKQLVYDTISMRYQSDILLVTDENQGKFYVEETKNPAGYTGSWKKELDITNPDESLQYTVPNTPVEYPKGRVVLYKTDSYTGELLVDAQFRIYVWNKETKSYEDSLGEHAKLYYDITRGAYLSEWMEINEQNEGKFKVKETKPPEGYQGEWQQEIVMNELQTEYEYLCSNEPIKLPTGKITVIKKIKEKDIIWAHGNPIFSFVLEGSDIRGNDRIYEEYVEFIMENYSVDTDGYAVLKVVFSNIPIGEYQVYEKPVLRYYLSDVFANTENVSVQHGKEALYGIHPKEIAYAKVLLDVEKIQASVTFINEKSRYDDYTHNSAVKNFVALQ